ncbi:MULTISPECIES: Asp-tRNA(Asn)/Glu-tRNA(Gln) amidotransferase subunit GatC [Candidatus Ichthyocystis]|uniref:Asp-tRNA(Asn)/Glu-tRNA(Gln) amidotransferase subunit GatC n=1 Tax=Candidatus Ichthyocystis TaxID=2929841 RepID=UPI000B83551A|nr:MULTISPECIES: Asp-tRNA(Asn)/Glu-tRNA(Gln) amidotransferase subunit GatC [Ichthyocystis]
MDEDGACCVSYQDVCELAAISRLSLSESECSSIKDHLNSISRTIDKLSNYDSIEGVDPMVCPLEYGLALRDDSIKVGDCSAQLEKVAPLFEEGLYIVPAVIAKR